MLKIKDNVDLKELEKFGFEDADSNCEDIPYSVESWDFAGSYYKEIAFGRRGQYYILLAIKNNRLLSIFATQPDSAGHRGLIDDTIFELIKADLVEKV